MIQISGLQKGLEGTVRQNDLRRAGLLCNLAERQNTLHFATLKLALKSSDLQ